MLSKDQNQIVGTGSTAIQAGGNLTYIAGVSIEEARSIALDVAKSTFYELSGVAKETATIRAEEITELFIQKLAQDFPYGLQKAVEPDFQHALLTVQKEYARNGDKDLGDLLVDLLVDRSKQDQRDILQIVLNESLITAPKLTQSHLATLAVIFIFKYTQQHDVADHQLLGDYLDKHILPFASHLSKNHAAFQHLEFCGCGSSGITGSSLESILGRTYRGLFLKGFDKEEILNKAVSFGVESNLFIECLNDNSKFQINALNKLGLAEILNDDNISEDDRIKIIELFDTGIMIDSEINEKVISIRPYMKEVFDAWGTYSMQTFTLTSVGMAIGHANIKRLIGDFHSLSIWVN